MSFPHIQEFKEIISECEGCIFIHIIFQKRICCRNVYPETKWWFGKCPDRLLEENQPKNP